MASIKTTVNEFRDFLELIGCKGKNIEGGKSEYAIREFVIEAKDGFLECCALDKLGKIFSYVKKNCQILEPGSIVIGDIASFEKSLTAYNPNDEVIITQDASSLKIERMNPKKPTTISAIDPEKVSTGKSAKQLFKAWIVKDDKSSIFNSKSNLATKLVVKSEDMWQIAFDSGVVGCRNYPVSIVKNPAGQMEFKIDIGNLQGSMGMITSYIPAEIQSTEEIKNIYAYGFDNVFNPLKGEVILYIGQNKPMWIVKETPEYSVRYMISPCLE